MSDNLPQNGYPIEVRILEIPGRGIGPAGIDSGTVLAADRKAGAACQLPSDMLLPFTATLRVGGDLPWTAVPGLLRVGYPDPHSSVVLEMREGDGHV
jgi:uncharacterized repeat protein (TIGR04076 family)